MPEEARSPEELEAEQQALATERQERLRRSSRRWLIGIGGTIAAFVVLVAAGIMVGEDDPWSGNGGALAERACGNASLAVRDLAAGTRSVESTAAALDDAAEDARSASNLNAKWSPLARSIVGARSELLAGLPGDDTAALVQNCGMD